ncbi:MFS transporter [Corynebacterium aquatimens]
MWRVPGFIAAMVAIATSFGSWGLLLPVVPVAVMDKGGTAALAGATTGVFMTATVLVQVITPWLLRRVSYPLVIAVSGLLMGVPALAYELPLSASGILLVSAIRGVGFGLMTVSESAVIAELVPRRWLGKATGVFGAAAGLMQMLTLPVGLWIAERAGYMPVWVMGLVIYLIGAAACIWIPRVKASAQEIDAHAIPAPPTWKLVLVPALCLTLAAVAYSILTNFLPASIRDAGISSSTAIGGLILAVVNLAVMFARYGAGVIADKRGIPGTMMIPGQIIGAFGFAGFAIAMATNAHQAWFLVAAFFFGVSFGVVQNESLLSMFHRLPRSKIGHASAVWNVAFDGGQAISSFFFGAIIAGVGITSSLWIATAVLVSGIVMSVADWLIGRARAA